MENGNKEALIKRNLKPVRLPRKQLIINSINRELLEAEGETSERNNLDELQKTDPKEVENYLFLARTRVIKDVISEGVTDKKFIKSNWYAEYEYITKNVFPYGWMINQKGIKKTLDHHELLVQMWNYLHNMAKEANPKTKNEMITLSNGEKHNKHPISCFIADSDFYKKITVSVGYSERMIRRYIKSQISMGAIKIIAKLERNTRVLSFGYYVPWRDKVQHRTYLKETTGFKKALRNFQVT